MYGGPGLPRPSTVTRSLHELQQRGSAAVDRLNQVARDGFTRVHPEGFTQRGVLRWGLFVVALADETVTALDAGVRRCHHALQGHGLAAVSRARALLRRILRLGARRQVWLGRIARRRWSQRPLGPSFPGELPRPGPGQADLENEAWLTGALDWVEGERAPAA